jgi:DsbC/DsbD-like thiol-disulfide interchange protein
VEAPDAKAAKHPMSLQAFASSLSGATGQTLLVAIRLSIKKGWHINSNKPVGPEAGFLIPTAVTMPATAPASLEHVRYPHARLVKLTFSKTPLAVYMSDNWLLLRLKVKAGKPRKTTVPIMVRYQACSDRLCLRPETLELRLPFEVTRKPALGPKRHDGIFSMLSKEVKKLYGP